MYIPKRLILFLLLVISFNYTTYSQWVPPDRHELDSALQLIYNLNFTPAEQIAKNYVKKYPFRPEGYFLDGMMVWVKILVDIQNPALDNQLQEKMDQLILIYEKLEKIDSLSLVTRFYKSAAIGFKSRLYGNREQWFQAARFGIKAFSGIKESLEGKVPHIDAKFGAGIYLFFAEEIPKEYPMLKPLMWFYPEGNKKLGIELLQQVADSGIFAQIEAKYFLGVIYANFTNERFRSWKIFKELNEQFPANAQFLYQRGNLAFQAGRLRDADSSMAVMEQRILWNFPYYYPYQFRYIYYMRGMIAEYSGKRDLAFAFYNSAINAGTPEIERETEHYLVFCLVRSANMLVQIGELEEAKNRYKKVLTLKEYSNSHKRAKDGLELIK